MKNRVSIVAVSSISALGNNPVSVWESYLSAASFIKQKKIGSYQVPVAILNEAAEEELGVLKKEKPQFKNLDKSVLMAILTARKAAKSAGWEKEENIGVNIGSSRGATGLFEKHHTAFLQNKKLSALASPTTTLGNISSWVAQDLEFGGAAISHSVTCSTALHSVLNGIAWLQSGMAEKFLVGGSEAPLTPFTLAQMQAMKIYSQAEEAPFCEALNFQKKKNGMVLGEAAGIACLEAGEGQNAVAKILGVGYAVEKITHNASISADATCFQESMKMAIAGFPKDKIDAIVMHAPGTIKGDEAELNAIKMIFQEDLPLLTSNKWTLGHTFGASGLMSLEFAVLMLQKQKFIPSPFFMQESRDRKLNHILINAVGFGGNAVSLLIGKGQSL